MVKIQFSVKNAFIQKYTLSLTVFCLVMTFMNMINRIHYIGASYAIGVISMGITNHIHNSLSITGIGCVLDMLHLIFRSSNSSSASVRYFQFIIHFLAIVFELMYMTMLHCYWQYTEATKNQPQTSMLKKQTILPIKQEQFNVAAQNPSVAMPQPIQVTGPDAAIAPIAQEPNEVAQNSISESPEPIAVTEPSRSLTGLNVTIPEPNSVSDPSTATELSETVLKPTLSSTETSVRPLNSIIEILQPTETTEPSTNVTELSNAVTDPITTMQEPNSAALDSFVETQNSIAEIESMPVIELDENAPNDNVILTEPSVRPQEYSVSVPEPKEEKQ